MASSSKKVSLLFKFGSNQVPIWNVAYLTLSSRDRFIFVTLKQPIEYSQLHEVFPTHELAQKAFLEYLDQFDDLSRSALGINKTQEDGEEPPELK
jgi:hypothetical protein